MSAKSQMQHERCLGHPSLSSPPAVGAHLTSSSTLPGAYLAGAADPGTRGGVPGGERAVPGVHTGASPPSMVTNWSQVVTKREDSRKGRWKIYSLPET